MWNHVGFRRRCLISPMSPDSTFCFPVPLFFHATTGSSFFLPNPLSQYQPLPSSPHRHRRVWALYFPVTTTSSMFLPPQYHPVGNKSSLGLLFNTISVQAFGPRRNLPIIPYFDLKLKRNLRENEPALSSLPPPLPSPPFGPSVMKFLESENQWLWRMAMFARLRRYSKPSFWPVIVPSVPTVCQTNTQTFRKYMYMSIINTKCRSVWYVRGAFFPHIKVL